MEGVVNTFTVVLKTPRYLLIYCKIYFIDTLDLHYIYVYMYVQSKQVPKKTRKEENLLPKDFDPPLVKILLTFLRRFKTV